MPFSFARLRRSFVRDRLFERYSESSRRAIFFARAEAQQEGSSYIETHHLLLGLLHDEQSSADQIFGLRRNESKYRSQVHQVREPLDKKLDLPLSNESKRVLAYTAEEAESLGHYHIESEHLILGLLREKECMAAKMLTTSGVVLQEARIAIAKHHGTSLPLPPSAQEQSATKFLRRFMFAVLALALAVILYVVMR